MWCNGEECYLGEKSSNRLRRSNVKLCKHIPFIKVYIGLFQSCLPLSQHILNRVVIKYADYS